MADANTATSDLVLNLAKPNEGKHNAGKPESAESNKLKNAEASANSGTETATMMLRGYPSLKAKGTVEVTGVGKGSGIWYCKTVVQEWQVDKGYITNVTMTKGGGGGSGGNSGGGAHGGEAVQGSPRG
jgi:hypothetical protein